jgi:hypothetical protein
MAADWLRGEIASGLQKLLALRLTGTPPEDAIVGTAEVWLEALECCGIQWLEHLDRQRVQRAFKTLFGSCDRWPAPKLFLANLGNRDPPPALPAPPLTAAEAEQNRAKLRAMVEQLAKSKKMSNARNIDGEEHEHRKNDS